MKSIWRTDCEMPEFPTLKGDVKTDVLIIGGGVAGILTAFLLHQNGINYILVEKDRICSGVTQNTTAKITFQHGLIYDKLLRKFGVEKSKLYLNAHKGAFEMLSKLCEGIECDYEIKDNCVYSTNSMSKIEDEITALEKIGYNAEFCKKTDLPFEIVGAVKFKNQAQFHPLKFLSKISENLNICENTFIKEMKDNTAVTNSGKIRAANVIITTHFPFINKHGSYFLKLYQHRSYVIALKNAQNVNGMYVDENEKGLSFRNYNDYLLLGGGSHRTGKKGGNWAELRSFAKKYYPDSEEKFYWATQDCMSLDSMPYIGNYSAQTSDLFAASGFNKWGFTSSMLSAMLLCDEITENNNDFAALFSPSRSILHTQLLLNGFESAFNFLTPSTKRCPHLGCALKWNKAEHSWDCPCHGSRFSGNGKLLDNPANGDLK